MEREKQESFKILMFPWIAHGHIFPYLELSKRLSTTHNFTIYLCSTAVNLDSIKSSISSEDADAAASVKLVELHMPSTPQLPPHLHTTKNLPSHLIPTLMKTFQESSSSFSDIMDSLKPDLVIYDVYQPWAPKIASSKGIPCVHFSTPGAAVLSLLHHIYTLGSCAAFPFPAIALPDEDIPRQVALLAQNLKYADDDFVFGGMTRSTDIVLTKSPRHVEEKYADYLSVLSKKQVVCTGPLIASDANTHDDFEIMEWLNGKDLDSTIYISFGSECFLSKEQIGEIAKGLHLCDVNFLWVIRFPTEEAGTGIRLIEEELPAGFLETVKERGLVVTRWAPQTKILGHPSIGGFVSHCGRSSITESMYFGVPVIAMPMNSDQPFNAQLVVELGVGVEVEKDHENGVYEGEEVAKAINKVMMVENNAFYEGLRSRARRLSETMRAKEEEEVNDVAQQLLQICVKNKK